MSLAIGGGSAALLQQLFSTQGSGGVQGAASDGSDGPDAAGSADRPKGPPPGPPPARSSQSSDRFGSDTLGALIGAQAGPPSADDLAASLIKSVDSDNSGSVSLDEIKSALSQGSNGTTTADQDSLQAAFTKLDTNGDGQLSASELSTALQAFQAQRGGGGRHHHHAAAQPSTATTGSTVSVSA